MTQAQQALAARAAKYTREHAAAQAKADHISAKLAKLEAQLAGQPAPETGLDQLWRSAPAMARNRSSKHACRTAWLRIPASERPTLPALLAAIWAWGRCPEWKKDGGLFVQGLDRWIAQRRWENLPETTAGTSGARCYQTTPKPPAPAASPEDLATPEDIAALKALFANPLLPAPQS